MFSFAIVTLGCKANQYDAAALAEALTRLGGRLLENASDASPNPQTAPNLIVISTCCVTATAMHKSRQAVRRAARRWNDASLLVTGCYSDYDRRRVWQLLRDQGLPASRCVVAGHHDDLDQAARQAIALVPCQRTLDACHPQAESLPLGGAAAFEEHPQAKGRLGGGTQTHQFISDETQIKSVAAPENIRSRRLDAIRRRAPGAEPLPSIARFPGHQRAFVKIQDGCDAFCAYCIVPYTRPRVWSRSIEQVVAECRQLARAGHREVVLSGVFLGAFGRATAIRRRWDNAPPALAELLRRLGKIEGLWKIRLSSLEPLDADGPLLDAAAGLPNFAPHFHLPLQSGSEKILRRMNRQYTPEQFRQAVARIRERFDRPALTADVIVGFPGEDEDDFARTLEMARFAGFSKMHAFPFSAIEGTAAWTYKDEAPPPQIVRRRMNSLAALERELAGDYRRQFVGQVLEALVEQPDDDSRPAAGPGRQAMTDRYLTVRFDGDVAAGQVVALKITGAGAKHLVGRLA